MVAMRFAPETSGKAARQPRLNRPRPGRIPLAGSFHSRVATRKKLPQGRYHLLLWREPESLEVKFMEVNPLVAALIRRLERGSAKPEALLRAVARQSGLKAAPEFLAEGRALLQDLRAKQILL